MRAISHRCTSQVPSASQSVHHSHA
ncbi:MAG: hypothetical protein ACJARS_003441 [bacterium]|jgi:hypothetical protein